MQLSKEKLIDISGELDLKMKCFLHKQTLELVSFPDELLMDDVDEDIWREQILKIKSSEQDYIEIDRMNSTESFQIMEAFTKTVKDNWVANRLLEALEGKNHLLISTIASTIWTINTKKHGFRLSKNEW